MISNQFPWPSWSKELKECTLLHCCTFRISVSLASDWGFAPLISLRGPLASKAASHQLKIEQDTDSLTEKCSDRSRNSAGALFIYSFFLLLTVHHKTHLLLGKLANELNQLQV